MKSFLIIIVFSFISYAGQLSVSHNGYSEMDSINTTIGNDSVTMSYGKNWFDLSGANDIGVLIKCNDTSTTGYRNDSAHFIIGVELGVLTKNSLGKFDTAWCGNFNLDTFVVDSANCLKTPHLIDNGGITYPGNKVDTVRVTGFATKFVPLTITRSVVPWAHYMRYYVIGLAKNKKGAPLRLYLQNCRRLYSLVHNM